MGHVRERVRKDGESVFQVRFVKKGYPVFSLTFDNRNAAMQWLEDNENDYPKKVQEMLDFRESIFLEMRWFDLKVLRNIVRPKPQTRKNT